MNDATVLYAWRVHRTPAAVCGCGVTFHARILGDSVCLVCAGSDWGSRGRRLRMATPHDAEKHERMLMARTTVANLHSEYRSAYMKKAMEESVVLGEKT